MKSLRQIFLIVAIFLNNNLFSSEDDKTFQEQSMLSVLYAQTSAEFSANNMQTYNNARVYLDKALADDSWTAALEQKKDFKNKKPWPWQKTREAPPHHAPHVASKEREGPRVIKRAYQKSRPKPKRGGSRGASGSGDVNSARWPPPRPRPRNEVTCLTSN